MIEVSSGITMAGSVTSFIPFVKNNELEGKFLESANKVANEVDVSVVSVADIIRQRKYKKYIKLLDNSSLVYNLITK